MQGMWGKQDRSVSFEYSMSLSESANRLQR